MMSVAVRGSAGIRHYYRKTVGSGDYDLVREYAKKLGLFLIIGVYPVC